MTGEDDFTNTMMSDLVIKNKQNFVLSHGDLVLNYKNKISHLVIGNHV